MMINSKSMRHTKLIKGATYNLTLPKSFTYDNGTKQSTAFNDVTWSTATPKYMISITSHYAHHLLRYLLRRHRGWWYLQLNFKWKIWWMLMNTVTFSPLISQLMNVRHFIGICLGVCSLLNVSFLCCYLTSTHWQLLLYCFVFPPQTTLLFDSIPCHL